MEQFEVNDLLNVGTWKEDNKSLIEFRLGVPFDARPLGAGSLASLVLADSKLHFKCMYSSRIGRGDSDVSERR